LIGRNDDFMTRAAKVAKLLGANSNPFDAFLLCQGIKTLPLRMDRHCDNAMAVAEFLAGHPAVEKVNFNGLSDHPDYAISAAQMLRPGALMSFELKGGFEKARHFINKLKVCVLAVSLGTIDTLVSHPASMSHAGMSSADRQLSGISDGLIRMSVGIEGIDDLLDDLDQALH
jgi:methionine-gamma-lyase